MDFWLHRSLDLAFSLRSDGGATATATIKLENRGPSSGEPKYVIGPFDERYKAGWNTQFIRLYLPGSTQIATKRSGGAGIANELGFLVAEWNVDIPPGGAIHRSLNFDIADAWDPKSGRLSLNLRRQAFLAADSFRLSVEPPWGKSFIFERSEACTKGTTKADVPIAGPLKTTLWGWIVGPWARDASCG
jgi:hypothetical protein